MKKLLITGIAGLLGGNLAYTLRDNYETCGIDRNITIIPGTKHICIDLLDFKRLKCILSEERPDVIVHCAALINVDVCEIQKDMADRMNISLTKEIADFSNSTGTKVVYISTDAVFDGRKDGFYTESDEANPINYYGYTKLKGEEEVLKYADNTVVRTNIFGYNIRQKHSLGEWVLYSLMQDKSINMFNDVHFSPIIVNDLALVIDKVIQHDLKGLYHVGSTDAISKYEFGIKLKEEFNLETGTITSISVDDFGFKAPRSKNMALNSLKVSETLNIKLKTPINYIKDFKNLYDANYHQKIKELTK